MVKVTAVDVQTGESVWWLLEKGCAADFAESLADEGYTLVSIR